MELSVTLKMHVLESHVLDFAKDLNTLGLLGEEPIERTHKDDRIESQKCNTNDFKASQIQLEKRRVLKQSSGVQKVSAAIQYQGRGNFLYRVLKDSNKSYNTSKRLSWNH